MTEINNITFPELIKDIELNYEYYKNNKLIDVDNESLDDLKLLEPGAEYAVSVTRNLPDELE